MSMKVAATWYTEDQDEPSDPFIIDLDCGPDRAAVESALRAYCEEYEECECDPAEIEFDWSPQWGDLMLEADAYLIIGFEPADRKALGL